MQTTVLSSIDMTARNVLIFLAHHNGNITEEISNGFGNYMDYFTADGLQFSKVLSNPFKQISLLGTDFKRIRVIRLPKQCCEERNHVKVTEQ